MGLPCGRCSACFRRWVAFKNNGLEEEYEYPILDYKEIPTYLEKMSVQKYDPQRTFETLNALRIAGYTKLV